MPPITEPLAIAIRGYAAALSASPAIGADVTIRLASGATHAVTLTPAELMAAALAGTIARAEVLAATEDEPPAGEFTPDANQRAILEVCKDSRVTLTAKEILEEAGIDVSSKTRGYVTTLADLGYLERCNPGFKISEAGKII